MSVYTVQAPPDSLGEPEFERAVFLREGFSWPAFFFGFFWLLWKQLWAPAALWLAADAGLVWLAANRQMLGTTFWIALALRLLLGLEAHALLRYKLALQRYRLVDVVVADAHEAAERLFFHRTVPLPEGAGAAQDELPSPPPVPHHDNDVLGFFPQPEKRR